MLHLVVVQNVAKEVLSSQSKICHFYYQICLDVDSCYSIFSEYHHTFVVALNQPHF